jgi:hypothetical protein
VRSKFAVVLKLLFVFRRWPAILTLAFMGSGTYAFIQMPSFIEIGRDCFLPLLLQIIFYHYPAIQRYMVSVTDSIVVCSVLWAGGSRVRLLIGSLICFSAPNPSSRRTMAPRFTQPVAEMSSGRFQGVKRGRRVRLTT